MQCTLVLSSQSVTLGAESVSLSLSLPSHAPPATVAAAAGSTGLSHSISVPLFPLSLHSQRHPLREPPPGRGGLQHAPLSHSQPPPEPLPELGLRQHALHTVHLPPAPEQYQRGQR